MTILIANKLCVWYALLGALLVLVSNGPRSASGQQNIMQDFMNRASDTTNAGSSEGMQIVRNLFSNLMNMGQNMMPTSRSTSSSMNPIYDVVRNDTALGVNVLSGLVKVDRVREPGKPRALSVRVFGMPVFNRGFARGDQMPTDRGSGSGMEPEAGMNPAARPASASEEEELPL